MAYSLAYAIIIIDYGLAARDKKAQDWRETVQMRLIGSLPEKPLSLLRFLWPSCLMKL